MFSRSSSGSGSASSQTPLNTILNTPALKVEFALVIFVCIDRMRKSLATTFEVDDQTQGNVPLKSPAGFPATRDDSHQAPPPYSIATNQPSGDLIDFDEPSVADPHGHREQKVSAPTIVGRGPAKPLKGYEQWDQQQSRQRLQQALTTSEMQALRRAALTFFDAWRISVLRRVGTTLKVLGDTVRKEKSKREDTGVYSDHTRSFVQGYEPVSTPLVRLEEEKRSLLVQSALLLLLGLENYPSHSRVLLLYLTISLDLPPTTLTEHELSTAKILLSSTAASSLSPPTSPPPESSTSSGLNWKVGLAAVGGAALIGVTGGLAAPLIAAGLGAVAGPVMGAFGLGGLATLLGGLIGNSVLVGALFGIYGGRRMGDIVEKLARDVEDFELLPLKRASATERVEVPANEKEKQQGQAAVQTVDLPAERLRVSICVTGSLDTTADVTNPWIVMAPTSTVYALRFETAALLDLGGKLSSLINSTAFSAASYLVLRNTVFATLMAGLCWPMGILKAASVIDSPFNVALARSNKAGIVLAQVLMAKAQGERPVTLIGYGLGARVIWECCQELARQNAFGLVGDLVFMGLPGPSVSEDCRETSAQLDWRRVRSVAVGRVINCYSSRDWLLRFMFRLRTGLGGVAGLEKVHAPGVENEDVSDLISAHTRYAVATGSIMQRISFETDDDELRVQVRRMVEAERHDESNETRQNADVERDLGLDDNGKVEMVDETNGKIVMLDLETGTVDEKELPATSQGNLLNLQDLSIEDCDNQPHNDRISTGSAHEAEIGDPVRPDLQTSRPLNGQESKAATEHHADHDEYQHDHAASDDEEGGDMAYLAPEPEPDPEMVSFGSPGQGISMTWDGR